MTDDPIQILEVRADGPDRPVKVTAAVSAEASQAIHVALTEELDRARVHPAESADEVLALREHTELVDRFAPLASSRAHAVVQLTEDELRHGVLILSSYRSRVDGEHYQPPELRTRIELIAQIEAVLWDANASVAAVHDGVPSPAAP